MKTLFISSLLFLISFSAHPQDKDPVSWNAVYKSTGEKEGVIQISASITDGWHTYSQRPTDDGPIPTSFKFAPSGGYKLNGNTEETGAKEEFVPAFDAKIYVFHDKAEFRQKIVLNGTGKLVVPVEVEYMTCNDMMCLPPKTVTLQVQVQK